MSTHFKVRTLGFSLAVALCLVAPHLAGAQSYPYPYTNGFQQLTIVTQVQGGAASIPQTTVTVNANGASLSGAPQSSNTSISYLTSFTGDTQTATFYPGTYSVLATPVSGYTFSYSPGCNSTYPINYGNSYGMYGGSSCLITAIPAGSGIPGGYGAGVLTIYTTVQNYNGYPYNGYSSTPSNFTVSVSGNAPSPAIFQGAQGGTIVTIGTGQFSVNPGNLQGWTSSPSGNCSGVIQSGQNLSCTITYTYYGTYYPGYSYTNDLCSNGTHYCPTTTYPYNYSYNYNYPYSYNSYSTPLSCLPSYQQVQEGQNASFTATGGVGTYNWTTPERNYVGIGAVLNVLLQGSGVESVVVSSGSQTATCTVVVGVNGGNSTYYAPANTPSYTTTPATLYTTPGVAYPSLPNTGFGPQNGEGIALAVVLLIAAGVLVYPYVRKAFGYLLQ